MLRTLIVALGGFCTVAAVILAAWYLLPLRRRCPNAGEERFASLLLGLVLLSYAGLAALTTDHIYRHLIANEAPAWQLWSSLTTFTVGTVTLLSLIAVRVDRKASR